MRIALALIMALHGIAHLVGFAVNWRLVASEELPYKTTILFGKVDLGTTGIRAVGTAWLLLAILFVAAAVGAAVRPSWWIGLAMSVVVASLVLSLAALPDTRIGVFVNALLLVALAVGPRMGWW